MSERFKHIHLNNNFSQTYEIISSVIQKDETLWSAFIKEHEDDFGAISQRYATHPLFSENSDELNIALYG